MKKILLSFGAALTMFSASAQIKLLLLNNSADTAAASVDVYVKNLALPGGEQKIIDNFDFRTAFFYDPGLSAIPTSTDVVIAPKNSTSSADGFYTKNFPVGILAGNYLLVLNGLVDTNYAATPNPSGLSRAFNLEVVSGLSFSSSNANELALTLHNGVVDAPAQTVQSFITTIQITPRDTVQDNLAYGSTTTSVQFPAAAKRLHYYTTGNSSASYQANANFLGNFANQAVVVFTSGLLNPPAGGANFGVFAIQLVNGQGNGLVQVTEFPKEKVAGVVQVYHNAADPAVKDVDLYVGGIKQVIGLSFRKAFQSAGFIQDFNYSIDLHKKDSSSSVLNTNLVFGDDSVVAVVSGVLNASQFKVNPDGEATALDFYLNTPARISAATGTTRMTLFNGSTDAAEVSISAPALGGMELASATKYGKFTLVAPQGIGADLPTSLGKVVVDVKVDTTLYKSYLVPLTSFDGKAVTVCTSGFLDTANNQNGASFKIFAGVPGAPFPTVIFLQDTSIQTSITNPATTDMSFRMFPNPASSELVLGFDLKDEANVSIEILDLNGKVVKTVLNDTFLAGTTYHTESVSNLSNGLYFARVKSGNAVSTYKFNILR